MKKNTRKNLAIVGLGLLGTSLGLALKKSKWRRLGWSRSKESRDVALKSGAVDRIYDDPAPMLREADLSVVCLPVPNIVAFCLEHKDCFRKGSVVTDVGSVKEAVVGKVASALEKAGVDFVGSHPMAGSEKSGAGSAYANLYNGAVVFLTPAEGNSERAVKLIKRLWEDAGASPIGIECREHDLLVAHTSHLPHIVSSALARAVLDLEKSRQKLRQLGCAGGFRDCTRTASSSPQMWREIIEHNRTAVLKALGRFEETLSVFRKMLESKEFDKVEKFLSENKEHRDRWYETYIKRIKKSSGAVKN